MCYHEDNKDLSQDTMKLWGRQAVVVNMLKGHL